jgi:hypothetical protein
MGALPGATDLTFYTRVKIRCQFHPGENIRSDTQPVIAGLDPAIQGRPERLRHLWMPGSSPGMTVGELLKRSFAS